MSDANVGADLPETAHFVGRAEERAELVEALTSGVNSIASVMGGRGMGKSSLLRQVERDLATHAVKIIRVDFPGAAASLLARVGASIGAEVTSESLEEALRAAIDREQRPLALLIDEIDTLTLSREGVDLLNNLRTVYENLDGVLRIAVFGGTTLRHLLDARGGSPFLRNCLRWRNLEGLSYDEAAVLIRGIGAAISDENQRLLWEETNGHPFLLKVVLGRALGRARERAASVDDALPEALHGVAQDEGLRATLFPMWWSNLEAEGQAMYRKLLRCERPVRRAERARVLGSMPDVWVPVLESTGVAREVGGEVMPRGDLFRAWVLENIPEVDPVPPPQVAFLAPGADDFEREVIGAVAQWVRGVREFPLFALRTDLKKPDNGRLQVEAHFQLGLLLALRQHGWFVEPEALSGVEEGYSDLKIRERAAGDRRACVECKIWYGKGYKTVVAQVMKYALPDDRFAIVVMVDRMGRPLAPAYRATCIAGAAETFPADGATPADGTAPAFVTEHPRAGGTSLRVYHFLLQLPADV